MSSSLVCYLRTAVKNRSGIAAPPWGDSLLMLFCWFISVLLSVVGTIGSLRLEDLGLFLLLSAGGLTMAVVGVSLLKLRRRDPTLLLFLCCAFLVVVPAVAVVPRASQRIVLLDLYFVSLLTVPVFLNIWSWHLQALAGALTTAAVSVLWLPVGSWVAAHSIALIGVTALLSFLVVLVRSRSAVWTAAEIEKRGRERWRESAAARMPQLVWNVLVLQGCLLLCLLFFDVAFWGDLLSQPLLAKVYGLIILVFGALLLKASAPEQLPRTLAFLTLMVGAVLSMARMGYADLQNPVAAIPHVLLACMLAPLPWPLVTQIIVVWSLMAIDLGVKALALFPLTDDWLSAIGMMMLSYRGEITLLGVGMAVSVGIARALQQHGARTLVQFDAAANAADDDSGTNRVVELGSRSVLAIEPPRRHRMVVSLFFLGVLASALISQLLISLSEDNWRWAMVAWGMFLLLWLPLARLERSLENADYFWPFGAFTSLVFFLVPCVVLLLAPQTAFLWLYWPVAVLLAVGTVPWRMRELTPLVLTALVTGVELLYQLHLSFFGGTLFLLCGLLAVLLSVHTSRRLKERHFLLALSGSLDTCDATEGVARVAADYLMQLWNSSLAFVSKDDSSLELIKGAACTELGLGSYPLRTMVETAPPVGVGAIGVTLRAANWLPANLSFFHARLGVVAPRHGLVIEFSKRDTVEAPLLLFLGSQVPIFEPLARAELRSTAALAEITLARLERIAERERFAEDSRQFSERLQEREYELSAMVHDINNTVQDLTLLCEGILEDALSEDGGSDGPGERGLLAEQIRRIADIARSVATVVSDAKRRRELERLADLQPRELVEVCSALREVVGFATLRAERKRISVQMEALPPHDVWVRISVREHFETILRNLLNNAISYSPPGSSVRVFLECDERWVAVRVTDTGVGVKPEERDAIFLGGYRGKNDSAGSGGLGLGLAESRRVAESAGGSVEVESEGTGKGSTFTVRLPRQLLVEGNGQAADWALIVDDQPSLLDFYSRLAKALHLDPGAASSVDEALALVEQRGRPKLVVTDIHLGASNGLELVRSIRAEFGNEVPILVVSGLTDDAIAEQVRRAGATDFVTKPVGRRALFARIQSVLPPSTFAERSGRQI
ncbi:MAG: hybrid sensor histidine kinase/response regulator [Bdellovibrionales bacterium]|nr:hybrid sensor histidine kinase/response regulator [Bdellovibrionales bacterium]